MATRTSPRRQTRSSKPRAPLPASSFEQAFPNSTKVYVEGSRGIRVPFREIALSGGEPPVRVYDSSGPQGHDVRGGLPAVRDGWIGERAVGGEADGGKADGKEAVGKEAVGKEAVEEETDAITSALSASVPTASVSSARLIPATLRRPRYRGRAPVSQLHY